MNHPLPYRFLAGVALAALAACGSSTSTTSTTTVVASAAPTTEAQRETAALPMNAAAPVPSGLNCGAVKPVWVNLNTKAYHGPDDPYYGKTKNGKYECPAQAVADGYHAAGATHARKHRRRGGSMTSAGASASPDSD